MLKGHRKDLAHVSPKMSGYGENPHVVPCNVS